MRLCGHFRQPSGFIAVPVWSSGEAVSRVVEFAAPLVELGVEIVQVRETPGEEEVLADATERALDFALGFRPVGFAGPRRRSVVVEQGDQRGVVDR